MNIFLVVNHDQPQAVDLAAHVRAFLTSHGANLVDEKGSVDAIISIGGDGTILSLIHEYPHLTAPVLGINAGHLGFMADVPVSNIDPSLLELLAGHYTIEERLVLEAKKGSHTAFAINDVVIHRCPNASMIEVSLRTGGLDLNTFEADGLILATPNGSTAYSLAAGGPIVSPSLDALVITPISPHTISNRPLVLAASDPIEIEYLSTYPSVEVSSDGIPSFSLAPREKFSVQKSRRVFKLIRLKQHDYFSTLRTKLGWSGKLRYK